MFVCACVCVQLMPYSGDSVVVYTAKIHNHHVFWLMIPVLVYFYCSAVTNFGHNRQSGKTVMKSMKMNKVGNKQKRLPFPQLVQIKTELKVDTAVETARNNVFKVQIILAIEMYKMTQTSEAR